MTHRRRASGTRRILPGVLLLAAGVLLVVGVPVLWSSTHQDPAMRAIDPGVAVRLAKAVGTSTPVTPGTSERATVSSGSSGAMTTVPTAGSLSTAASPYADRSSVVPRSSTSTPPRSSASTPTAVNSAPTPPRSTSSGAQSITPPRAPIGAPTRLRIPAIGVDAPIESVGVNNEGEMAIPEQVQQIGWYKFGPAPGASSGSIVMSGHIDSREQGLGAFHDLGDLDAGDLVTVADAAGRQLTYRVVGKEAFDKKVVPLADLFSRAGAPRLTLMTCGGAFDAQAHSYLDNIVVTAVPA